MPILYPDIEQGTDAWDRLRMGIPTSSSFDKIITPEGKPSKQWEKYAHFLLAERFCDRNIHKYTSQSMEHGKMIESDAAEDYELQNNVETKKIGFVTNNAGTIGCSPDRLVGEDGLLEIKVPDPDTQMGYILTGKVDKEYKPQLQGQLYVTQRKWVVIKSFNPELPRCEILMERDEAYIACLHSLMEEFNDYLAKAMAKILEMQPLRIGAKFYVKAEMQY